MSKNILITCIGCAPASAICRALNNKYNIYGIDMKEICIGNFICNFIQVNYKFNTDKYWEKIYKIIEENKIEVVFVSLPFEAKEWSLRKNEFLSRYNSRIMLNNEKFCELTNNKENTYNFCIKNNINIPPKMDILSRPIVIKEINGCGSQNLQILKTIKEKNLPFNNKKCIIQKFIEGDEYTCDVLSDPNGNIVNIIPKKRCFIKNGQSFISKIIKDKDVINFVYDVCKKIENKCAINVQVIKENNTNKIYLIEINPRFATSISLSIKGGVNIPEMLIENDYETKNIDYGLTMVRDYKEYFLNNNIISDYKILERNCLTDTHEKNIIVSNYDKFIFKHLRNNINKFFIEMKQYINNKREILEIGEYWDNYKGAKKLYPELNILSVDIDPKLNPDYVLDITKKTHFDDEKFDSIICLEVIEHTREPLSAIKEMTRILKKDGYLFLSAPCNYRIHAPFPDSWRFTHHFYKVIAHDYNYKLISLKCIEDEERLLFPFHYTCILQKQ